MELTIAEGKEGKLNFELTFRRDEDSSRVPTFVVADDAHSASFEADLLASNELHVLQVPVASYEEFAADDENLATGGGGYVFVRVIADPVNESLTFNWLDLVAFARVAEESLSEDRMKVSARDFSDCIRNRYPHAATRRFMAGDHAATRANGRAIHGSCE